MSAPRRWRTALFLMLLAATTVAARGQMSTEQRNAISVDVALPITIPISLAVGERSVTIPVQIQYQRVISDHLVLLLKAGLNYSWTPPLRLSERGLDLYPEVEVDWHPFHKGLGGPYVGLSGFFDYSVSLGDPASATTPLRSYSARVGPVVGWQVLLPANITLDPAIGFGFGPQVEVAADGTRTSRWTMDPTRIGLFVGLRF